MPAAARLDDPDTSDGAITSEVCSTVFIDGKPAATVGSMDRDHAPYRPRQLHQPHVPNPIVQGSSTVFWEGKAAARVGDPFQCGHTVASGSPTVDIGG
jgi:uncharacterized Zn-binding protein involved in type VI secretion